MNEVEEMRERNDEGMNVIVGGPFKIIIFLR